MKTLPGELSLFKYFSLRQVGSRKRGENCFARETIWCEGKRTVRYKTLSCVPCSCCRSLLSAYTRA